MLCFFGAVTLDDVASSVNKKLLIKFTNKYFKPSDLASLLTSSVFLVLGLPLLLCLFGGITVGDVAFSIFGIGVVVFVSISGLLRIFLGALNALLIGVKLF